MSSRSAGKMRVHVGVGGAVDETGLRLRERELRQVVLIRLRQRHQPEQHRQVHLDLRRHPLERALQPDAAVQVVEHRGDDQHDEQRREDPARRELQERQPEHVERDVLVELRILDPERRGVREQDPVRPLLGDTRTHDEREEQRHQDPHPPRVRRDVAAVALDDLVFGTGAPIARRDAVGDDEIDEHRHEEDRGEDQRGNGLRRQQRAPRLRVADVFEPQIVGVETREPAQAQEQDDQNDGGHDEPGPQAERTSTALDRRNSHPADSRSRPTDCERADAGSRCSAFSCFGY